MTSKIQKVVVEMLIARGFKSTEIDVNTDVDAWTVTAKCSSKKKTIRSYTNTAVVYIDEKINKGIKENIKKARKKIKSPNQYSRIIVVTPAANIRIKTEDTLQYMANVEARIVSSESLAFNVLKHSLVPLHVEMTTEEIQELATRYETDVPTLLSQLPNIGIHDPVSRFLGGRQDSVYRITRNDGSLHFRRVVADFGI